MANQRQVKSRKLKDERSNQIPQVKTITMSRLMTKYSTIEIEIDRA